MSTRVPAFSLPRYVRFGLAFFLISLLMGGGAFSAVAQEPVPREELTIQRGETSELRRMGTSNDRRALRRQLQKARSESPTGKLEQSQANLVTRAAAGLPGVYNGSISVGDVDEDGNLDVLLTGSGRATLYLGNGDGTFSAANANLTGVSASSASIADIDGDTHLDLLITGKDGSGTAVTKLYLGAGDGTFTTAGANLSGVRYGTTSVGDFNEDGDLDVLVIGEDNNNTLIATLYLGNGDGTFDEAGASLSGVMGGDVSVADVDKDSHLDVLVVGDDSDYNSTTTLYLGDGDGTFSTAGAGLANVGSGSVSIDDVNDDSNPDVLLSGEEGRATTLYLGSGDATFTEAGANLTGVLSSSTSIADVNGDGHQDLLVTGSNSNYNRVATVYLGAGDGTFTKANAGLTGVSHGSTTIEDVDGDGDQDLLITGEIPITGNNTITGGATRLYINRRIQALPNRDPRFGRTFNNGRIAAGLIFSRTIEAGDSDGDRVSIQLTNGPSNVSFTDAGNGVGTVTFSPDRSQAGATFDLRFEVSDSKGATASFSGTIEVPPTFATVDAGLNGVEQGVSTSIADVNDDGHLDVLICGSGAGRTTTLYLGNGDGTFTMANANLVGVNNAGTSIADVDGDGHQDLLITGKDGNWDKRSILYLGNGDGTFSKAGASLTGVKNGSTAIADVNGDSNLDLLIVGDDPDSQSYTSATLYLGNGDGTFDPANAGLEGVWLSDVAIADVNGDMNQDLLITGQNDNSNPSTILYLGNGDGTFDKSSANLTDVRGSAVSVGDVNRDDAPDLLISGIAPDGSRSTTLYLGNGDGTFSKNTNFEGVQFGTNSIGDFDEDGNQDLLVLGEDSDANPRMVLYRGNGDGTFSETDPGLLPVGNVPSTSVIDVNADGFSELLIAGRSGQYGATAKLYENLSGTSEPVASASATVDGSESASFDGTGLSVDFAEGTSTGNVSTGRYDDGPDGTDGIEKSNVSNYRVVINADADMGVGDGSEVRFDASQFEGVEKPSNVTVYSRPGVGTGSFTSLPTNYDDGTDEIVATVDGFSEFAFASNDSDNALPVELAQFEATRVEGEAVRLTWQSASETNNAGFAVQHRSDTTAAWQKVGFVESKAEGGTTTEPRRYQYRATGLTVGTHRFRLKQVDTDGTEHLSSTIQASVRMQEAYRLVTYPNPVRRRATVEVAVKEAQDVEIGLYDVLGRRVATLHEGRLPAQQTKTLSLEAGREGLSSGTYFLRLTGAEGTRTSRLTIVR